MSTHSMAAGVYSPWRQRLVAILVVVVTSNVALADDSDEALVSTSDRIGIAGGKMVVCWKTPPATTGSVLIHFHGAIETVRRAYAASTFPGVLVIVNFPGLSSAYANPVAENSRLFDQILTRAWADTHDSADQIAAPAWDEIWLSSFSAGYGAVREILKSDADFERIDALVAADSIYAGLKPTTSVREVKTEHMQDFLRFARLAVDGEKRFVLSHSEQPTPYASTTETADFLLRSLDLERNPDTAIEREGLSQQTSAMRGGLVVLGFTGTTGQDHMRHLHNIDLLWDRCLSAKHDFRDAPSTQ